MERRLYGSYGHTDSNTLESGLTGFHTNAMKEARFGLCILPVTSPYGKAPNLLQLHNSGWKSILEEVTADEIAFMIEALENAHAIVSKQEEAKKEDLRDELTCLVQELPLEKVEAMLRIARDITERGE